MFNYYEKGIKSTSQDNVLTIDELIKTIQDHPNKELIRELRGENYKSDRYVEIKEKLPCITPAGLFRNSRKEEEFMKASGYLFFDIDAPTIDTDIDDFKNQIILDYKQYICLLGKSVGGRGLFFYIRVNGISKDNYSSVYEYYRTIIFKDLNTDNNAKGINRAHIIPYDSELYINLDISLPIPDNLIIDNKENRTFNIKVNKESRYILKVPLLPINEVFQKLKTETEVEVKDTLFEINPVDYLKLFIPKTIQDGNKHKIFRVLTEVILFLNPDASLLLIQSFINYVNQNHTTKAMKFENMMRTVENTFNKIKETGESNITFRTKTLHFNKDCGLTGDQKRSIAAKVNGLLKSFKSTASIIKAKEKLATLGKSITKSSVCIETGFCYKTIHRNWDKDLTEILNEINTYNRTVNSGVLDTQILDEINNECYCLETGEAA